MKKKRIIKGVAIIMSLLSMLGLVGCNFSTTESDNKKVIEFLNKKYNKEFKISENLHKWGAPLEESKAKQGIAYCVDNPDETFNVILDDAGLCSDTYQNITMRTYAQEHYEKIMEQNWSDCKIWVDLVCISTKDEVYSKENYATFLTNEGGYVSTWIFIPKGNRDTEKESINIYSLSKELEEKGLKGTFCYAYTTDNSSIDNEKMKDGKRKIEDYIEDGVIANYCIVYIDKDESLSLEGIKNDLEKN